MRLLRLALLLGAALLAVAAEWVSYQAGDLALVVADALVGLVLVTCGVVAWERRGESRVGPLMALSGYTWFAGNLWPQLLYLHRGPLVHLHISYPTGRLRRRLAQATVGAAYVNAIAEPLARIDLVTLVIAALVAAAALEGFLRASGTARRAGVPALAAALTFACVLALGAVQRLAGWDADREVLWAYDVVIACLVLVLLVDLLRGRWAEAVVADLVVDLGKRADTRTLRDELGRALGDRSLLLGYWLPEEDRYVDDAGRPIELPEPAAGRAVTPIAHDGQPVAVLVHDQAVLEDPALVDAVASAASMAVTNARLQAEVRARVLELAASRRRIVEAADDQRRRLERELRDGAERRLAFVEELIEEARADADGPAAAMLTDVEEEIRGARAELHDFAQGIHPSTLTEGGLAAALPALTVRAGLPVKLSVAVGRLAPTVEAAVYFLCSEALANAAKYAEAARMTIDVDESDGFVLVVIADDGIGGADASRGSGLRGLADRVEALGGQLSVRSPMGGGTRLDATIPADEQV
ncbi:MAG: sensor histidine kinase [Acidimicrobiales bacterium]